MAFLGIDQSLNATGLCRLGPDGAVQLRATVDPEKRLDGPRLVFIKQVVASLLEHVEFAAMEGYSYDSVGRVFELGEIGGVLKVLLIERNVPYIIVPPVLLKKFATGNTSATKEQMIKAAQERAFHPADDNQADAFFLAHIARTHKMDIATCRRELEVLHTLCNPEPKKKKRRVRRLVKAAI